MNSTFRSVLVAFDYSWSGCTVKTFKLATDSGSGKSNMASSARIIQTNSAWFQKKINLRPQHRGVHLVTEEILRQIPEMSQFAMGLCHVQSKSPPFPPALSSLTFNTLLKNVTF